MNEFSLINKFSPISYNQFYETALKLEDEILKIKNDCRFEVLLANRGSQIVTGSLMKDYLKKQDSRISIPITQLSPNLYKKASQKELFITTPYSNDPYMITISNEIFSPNVLHFYAQSLDSKSQTIFNSLQYETFGISKIQKLFQKKSNSFSRF